MNKVKVIVSVILIIISVVLIVIASRNHGIPTPKDKEEKEGVLETISATIKTEKGDIKLELYPNKASNTVTNFINKANEGVYDGLTFHRVEDWVIQGGDPKGDGTGGGEMPTEINDLPFVEGSLGVARGDDINVSNDSQFFITKKESGHLNNNYTNFGKVVEGMDVVNSIEIGDKIISVIAE